TSATLAVGGSFDYMRQRLGLEHAREAILPSHFDFGLAFKNGCLIPSQKRRARAPAPHMPI
ncbi:MAG: hypothetical protein WBQ68_12930, partial [Terriglobales bacterium]